MHKNSKIVLLIIAFLFSSVHVFGQNTGSISGTIVDKAGDFVKGATVSLSLNDGSSPRKSVSDTRGKYTIDSLVPGEYLLIVSADGFEQYDSKQFSIRTGEARNFDIELSVLSIKEEVSVGADTDLSNDSDRNKSATILKAEEIESLPDDPESLTAVLQAMAGPTAGGTSAQLYVDGFSSGEAPPKDTIREIRINNNPYSSEFAQVGHGRIQIFTRPGTGRFHFEGSFTFMDESLNSRSPLVFEKVPTQNRQIRAFMNDTLIKDKLSYSLNVERYKNDVNKTIKATILDASLNESTINKAIKAPQKVFSTGSRFDYQLGKNHTLTGRYHFSQARNYNSGIGDSNLESRGFKTKSIRNRIRISETSIISDNLVNETRIQYQNSDLQQSATNDSPSLNVFGAFNGGGSPVGESSDRQKQWEITNLSTFASGDHAIRAGVNLRGVNINSNSPQNFNGAYSFAGGFAPKLDDDNEIIFDANGEPIWVSITSLERYRRTLYFSSLGFSAEKVREFGGGATQFSLASGNPIAKINQKDVGGFIQDDWRLKPNLTLSLGLRYEAQTNVSNNRNFAPRIAFAWSPKFGKKESNPSLVIRAGGGIFFSRIGESISLRANRFNGANQRQYIVDDPSVLNLFPLIPSTTDLQAAAQSVWRVAENIRSPYTFQSSFSVETQLPKKTIFVATFINSRSSGLLRARNINAPLLESGIRPFGEGNIYQFESSGISKRNSLDLRIRKRAKTFFLSAGYTIADSKSDTNGATTFPGSPYDLSNEFGRSAIDIRHRFTFRSFINMPWNMYLSNFIIASSGTPFNITTGQDSNGDSLFNDRPGFATNLSRSSVVKTEFGDFDIAPTEFQQVIPRNYGEGPGFFAVNSGIFKTIGFGPRIKNRKGKHTHRGDTNREYNLTFGVRVSNLFNNVNLAPPIGNLSSPLFGQSTSILSGYRHSTQTGGASNRMIRLSLRISY